MSGKWEFFVLSKPYSTSKADFDSQNSAKIITLILVSGDLNLPVSYSLVFCWRSVAHPGGAIKKWEFKFDILGLVTQSKIIQSLQTLSKRLTGIKVTALWWMESFSVQNYQLKNINRTNDDELWQMAKIKLGSWTALASWRPAVVFQLTELSPSLWCLKYGLQLLQFIKYLFLCFSHF